MRIASSEPFHVNCQHTKRSICYCVEGTPVELRDPAAAKKYSENARILNEFWEQPTEALFSSTDAVDVIVPRLLRRERVQASPPEPPTAPNTALTAQLEEAKKKSTRCAMMAASLAARGGLLYSPPTGVDIKDFLQQIKMHDQSKLESAVSQVLRNRSELAKAATTAAEVAARGGAAQPFNPHFNGLVPRIGGGDGLMINTTAPTPTAQMVGIMQQHAPQTMVMVANQSLPHQPLIKFPIAHRRGPRKRRPAKAMNLLPEDNNANLVGKLIQIFIESTKEWRPAVVAAVDIFDGSATVVFESDEQHVVSLRTLIENDHVTWLNKEDAEEKKSLRSASLNNTALAGGGGGGISGRKRGATGNASLTLPSKLQMLSPPSSSVGGGDSLGITGMSGGSAFAVGAVGAGSKETRAAAAAAAAVEDEEDKEKVVLERLKGVTKRQRAAAAKKVQNNQDKNNSKTTLDGNKATNATYAAAAAAGNGIEAPSIINPLITQTSAKQDIIESYQQQRPQTSLPVSLGLITIADDPNLLQSAQNSTEMGSILGYGSVPQHQQQLGNPRQARQQQQQQEQQLMKQLEYQELMRSSSLVMPSLFQLGDVIMRGKAIQLTISNITLPATVHKIDPERQCVVLGVKGRVVVLKAQDEGIKYKLTFI